MKFFITLSLLFVSYFVSAKPEFECIHLDTKTEFILAGPGKKNKRIKRKNKRRRKACKQWGKKVYAG